MSDFLYGASFRKQDKSQQGHYAAKYCAYPHYPYRWS